MSHGSGAAATPTQRLDVHFIVLVPPAVVMLGSLMR